MAAKVYPEGAARRTDFTAACATTYDVVLIGGGISGAIIAYQLGCAGKRVLLVEAGTGDDITLTGYARYVQTFYAATSKDNQSPYPVNPDVPMPRSTDARKIRPGQPNTDSYLVQNGPYATDSTYTRFLGGTTLHWEAKTPRLLPEDFKMRSTFGVGEDWPLSYDDLEPHYREAEKEIGVSGEVKDQAEIGLPFPKDYVFPMHGLPLSYLDQMVAKGVDGTSVELGGHSTTLKVRAFPQGRNGVPNKAYKDEQGRPFSPVGAVSTHQVEEGGRCQGNNNCVPICPIQAKYHAFKTLAKAVQTGSVDLLAQTVASGVVVDAGGRVGEISVKHYRDPASPKFEVGAVRGKVFVLGANAIENARLLLASELGGGHGSVANSSGLVGRNLMDHAYLLTWALMPVVCGTMRGTNCTGGIVDLRRGPFRRLQAAFAVDIHNDGWGWAVGSPYSDLATFVDDYNKFGESLRRELVDRITRQLLLAFMIEVPPSPSNRVTVNSAYTDALGNPRPVISYSIPEYTMRGAAYARQFSRLLFQRLGAEDHTAYDPADCGFVTHEGKGYCIRGGNHLAGTHMMGTSAANSVVDSDQRSWDHRNLFVVGGGSMPTIGTANVTLTMAAMSFRTARAILKDFDPGNI